MKKSYSIVLLASILLSGCSHEHHDSDSSFDGRIKVNFKSLIQTRLSGNQWDEGDDVGVFMYEHESMGTAPTVVDNAFNCKYLATSTGLQPSSSKDELYYPVEGSVDFIAYYPFGAVSDNCVSVDVSNQINQSRLDLLYSNNLKDISSSTEALTLSFERQMAKIEIIIDASGVVEENEMEDAPSLVYRDIVTSSAFSLTSGSWVNEKNKQGNVDAVLTYDDEDNLITAGMIMIPQDCSNAQLLLLLPTGKVFSFNMAENSSWEAGYKYTYELSLTQDNSQALKSEISSWVDATDTSSPTFTEKKTWTGASNTSWYNAQKTSFFLTAPEDLAGLAELVNGGNSFENKDISLLVDMDMANETWIPIGVTEQNVFKGNLYGNGVTISNLNLQPYSTSPYVGLLGVSYGEVKDLVLEGTSTMESVDNNILNVGSFCAMNYGQISGCRNRVVLNVDMPSSTESKTMVYLGGIVSVNNGTVSDCENYAELKAVNANTRETDYIHLGGICAANSGTVSDCENISNLTATNGVVRAGGIAGLSSGEKVSGSVSVSTSLNYGDVVVSASHNEGYCGGVVGKNASGASISGVANHGGVSILLASGETVYGGGLVALNDSGSLLSGENHGSVDVISSVSEGTIAAAGGILGYNQGLEEVHQVANYAFVTASGAENCYVGGIAGYNQADDVSTSEVDETCYLYPCCVNQGMPSVWAGNATDTDSFTKNEECTH